MEQKLITFMRLWKTQKGDPMWQCRTSDGEKVNAFISSNPSRHTFGLFEKADYSAFLNILSEGEQITWNACPIKVTMRKSGEYWELCSVETREPDALPDVPYSPVAAFWEGKAISTAKRIIGSYPVAIFDCETTGLDMATAEIVSMGMVLTKRELGASLPNHINYLVKPSNLAALEATKHIHGITAEQVVSYPSFAEYYDRLNTIIGKSTLVVYNAGFDPLMLDLECERAGRAPFDFRYIFDAMQIVSWFFHEPNGFGWRQWKLVEAAEKLGIEVETAHDALADAITTFKVLSAIAAKDAS